METQYYTQKVEILLERDSDVFRRIEALSEKTGKPVEEVFHWAAVLGFEDHMAATVRLIERLYEE